MSKKMPSSKSTPILKAIWNKLEKDTFATANNMSVSELENVIKQASSAYYSSDKPLISDSAFDIMVDILRQKSPNSDVLEQVGSELPDGASNKVALPYHLGSMDKIKPGSRALSIWLDKYNGPYTISEKLDGLSGLLVVELNSDYNKHNDSSNELVMHLYTRGDGSTGQDISHLLPYLRPLNDKSRKVIASELKSGNIKSSSGQHIAIRGEIILDKKKYETKYADSYPKARSMVAGLVNAKPTKYNEQLYRDKAADMDFVAYQIIEPGNMTSQQQFNKLSKDWNMKVAKNETIAKLDDVLQLEELFVDYKDKSLYEIDGIIVADDSKVWAQPKSGNPKHSVAFKMALEGQTSDTTVVNVEYNISKQGYLKPRVQFEPVIIGGDTITFATGFNAKFIKDNKLGPGAKIKIIKSGDVIPYIKHVSLPATNGKWQEPSIAYTWTETNVDALVEDPSQMPEYISSRLTYFFNVMKVDGLRQGTVDKLVSAGFDSVELILSLKPESLVDVDGFATKGITKLLASIKRGILDKEHPLPLVMAASGCFPGFGRRKIDTIIHGLLNDPKETSNSKFMDQLEKELTIEYDDGNKNNIVTVTKLSEIPSIAATTAKMFITYLDCFHRWHAATTKVRLQSLANIIKSTKLHDENPKQGNIEDAKVKQLKNVTGASVLFTGFRDDELEQKLEKEYNVTFKSSMSSQVTLLVIANLDTKNSKVEKAKKMGITIMTRAELVNKLT